MNKKKKYDLTYDNLAKIKLLDKEYFSVYSDFEKALFKKSKDITKTNILISDLLDEMLASQEKGISVKQLVGNNKQLFVDRIDKKIKYKERLETIKSTDVQSYNVAGLWMTMCGYIVLLFIKELLSGHYLIHYYVDLAVAVVALVITIHNVRNQIEIIKRYKLSRKPLTVQFMGFGIGAIVAIMMYKSPFDVTFAILVCALFTNMKLLKKELKGS